MNATTHRLSAGFRAAALSALTLALATTAIATTTDGATPLLIAQSTQPPAPQSDDKPKREARPKAADANLCYEYRWRQVGHPGKGPWKRVRVPVSCDRQR